MDSSTISARVQAVVAQTFGLPEGDITPSSGIGNPTGWDSFGHMQVVAAVEEAFGVSFPSYKLAELQDVQAIAAAVAELLPA
jgi:acyl carrier protein